MVPILRVREDGKKIEARLARGFENAESIREIISAIVRDVRENGDEAVLRYTEKFDKVRFENGFKLDADNIGSTAAKLDKKNHAVIQRAARRIEAFHKKQTRDGWLDAHEDGSLTGQTVRPLETVGAYIPGGRAAYPSTVLMTAIPARIAGVGRIIIATPPDENGGVSPAVAAAAQIAGAGEIYMMGGGQAIAAMAYGTESVPRVDKIVGPGNAYVAAAKKLVYGDVGIDSVAGPSEITIICDGGADPSYAAADMLSQAEHDEMTRAVCITTDQDFAVKVAAELEKQLACLPRREIAAASLRNNGFIAVASDIREAVELANGIAPEHLELCVREPLACLHMVRNAGAVFLGDHTPESLGDYLAGPNHVLPTGGSARFFSPLSVDDFIKKTSVLYFPRRAMDGLADDVMAFAEMEGLSAHGRSASMRKY